MESGNERQHPSESSITESDFQSFIATSKPCEKNSIVGPFGDSPNKNDHQRKKLLNWLKETQQKRDENNKRIFCRWLGTVEKGNTTTDAKQPVTSVKPEQGVKTEYVANTTPKVNSIPYDAFYTMTPVYYTYPTTDYYMMGPEQQNMAYYNNYVQRTPCPCYPYCYQTPNSTMPCDVQMPAAGPPPPPPSQGPSMNVMSPKDSQTKADPLQFNISEWYSALESGDVDGGQMMDNIQPQNDSQQRQSSLDFSTMAANNNGPVAYSVSSLVPVTSPQTVDFS